MNTCNHPTFLNKNDAGIPLGTPNSHQGADDGFLKKKKASIEKEKLLNNLRYFTGTLNYYKLFPFFVVTDGLKYLIEEADCYWLAVLYESYLVSIDSNSIPFTNLEFKKIGLGAKVNIEDGNGNLLKSQTLEYTDFPLDEFTLFACWDGRDWVAMLPSEY